MREGRGSEIIKILVIVEINVYYAVLSTFVYVFKFSLEKSKQLLSWGK